MKVLVTGGAGFIGSHLVDAYLEAGYDVAIIDDLSTGRETNLNPNARFHRGDIASPEAVDRVFAEERPDYLNHHAAQIDVRKSVADPAFDARTNVFGTINLLQACIKHGVKRVVFASSGGVVYGEPEYLPADEAHPLIPVSPYGVTKVAGEKYLGCYAAVHGLPYVALRYGNVYGPRQDPLGEAGVVAIFCQAMLGGNEVKIFGDGEQLRDYVYVGDVARANLLATETDLATEVALATSPGSVGPGGKGVAINIGTAVGSSVNDLYRSLAATLDYDGQPVFRPPREGEIEQTYLTNDLARELLGWRPEVDLDAGLALTAKYFGATIGSATGQSRTTG